MTRVIQFLIMKEIADTFNEYFKFIVESLDLHI